MHTDNSVIFDTAPFCGLYPVFHMQQLVLAAAQQLFVKSLYRGIFLRSAQLAVFILLIKLAHAFTACILTADRLAATVDASLPGKP